MRLDEAQKILRKNGFIVEGAYKELIHSRIGEIRQKRAEDEKSDKGRVIKLGKIMAKVYKETKEFIDDLADELVSDKITCEYDKNSWRISIQVEDKQYHIEMKFWGEFVFEEKTTIGFKDWRTIISTSNISNISDNLEDVFDYITKEAV